MDSRLKTAGMTVNVSIFFKRLNSYSGSSIPRCARGEWYWKVNRSGEPNPGEEKTAFGKCPYHNSRACLEVIVSLEHALK
jgi:mannobiose 2-epimerase